jgi:hypothetical protein
MSTQVNDKASSKHASFVEAQLSRAESRIRLIDLSAALLGFVAGTLAYAVVMILLDRFFSLSGATRQVGLLLYLVGAGFYVALVVVRPLLWRVNPYFAARQLEQTLPGSRNHVINWIDLRDQKLPAVIKTTLGQRAAKDLSRTDVDRAIASTRALFTGGIAALLVVLFVTLFLLFGPAPFGSYLNRAFAPFGKTAVATRTQVQIVRPENGDAVVTIGNPVIIVAQVTGRVPAARDRDAPCLLYRHDPAEPYQKRYLLRDDTGSDWATTVAPKDVGNGFWYKVTAGDAETPEYHVRSRAAPLIADFLATYRYRPYVGKVERTRTRRKLEDLRGTAVTIDARTNRIVKEGQLDFEGSDGGGQRIRGERVPGDPKSLRFRVVLDHNGRYRIRFTSSEGEPYVDPVAYDVVVIPDHAPQVRITHPAKDVTLPIDGHLEIRGEASDDIGIARLALCLEIAASKTKLKSRPYLADKLGKPGYGTPREIAYQHVLDLKTLVDQQGKPAELKPGTVIEYWLEAADACDFPEPNVTLSTPRYKITISDQKENELQKKDRQEAQDREKKNEKQQDEQLQKENAEREQQRQKDKQDEENETKNREQKKKDAQTGNKGESKEDDKGETKPDDKGQGSEGQKKQDEKTGETASKLQKEMNDRQQKDGKDQKEGKGKKSGDEKSKDGKEGDKPGDEGRDGKEKDRPSKEGAGKEKKDKGKEGEKDKGKASSEKDRGKNDKDSGKPKKGQDKGNDPKKGSEGNSQDKSKRPRPEDAKPSDAEQAAKDLKSNDPQKRGQARRDLQEMQQKAKDPQTRDAAGKALEQAKKEGDNGPGDGKPDEPKKDGKSDKGKGKPDGKEGDPKEDEGPPPGSKKKGKKNDPAGTDPGEGGDKPRTDPGTGGGNQEPPKRSGDKPVGHRASMMQLEEFRKNVDKDILKKLKMSEKDFQKFLRDYADMARRQQAEKEAPEILPPPSSRGTLPGISSGAVRRPGGKPGEMRNEGRPKPPPGYGDAYPDFLQRLMKPVR